MTQASQPDARFVVRDLIESTADELDRLTNLFDLYRVHYDQAADGPRTRRWLDENIASRQISAFVGEDRGTFVGFAITVSVPASLRLRHFWQIRDLFVLPSHRRLGVAQLLLGRVSAAAIEADALRLTLATEVNNFAALDLYSRCGYTTVEGYCSLELPLEQ